MSKKSTRTVLVFEVRFVLMKDQTMDGVREQLERSLETNPNLRNAGLKLVKKEVEYL